mmetsp:Transcript_10790/g.20368  ORF Transcript_10790/g.20368 Transcript_10790/m.20368 type:complete len:207 (-) Transcript_10790:51-671(-)
MNKDRYFSFAEESFELLAPASEQASAPPVALFVDAKSLILFAISRSHSASTCLPLYSSSRCFCIATSSADAAFRFKRSAQALFTLENVESSSEIWFSLNTVSEISSKIFSLPSAEERRRSETKGMLAFKLKSLTQITSRHAPSRFAFLFASSTYTWNVFSSSLALEAVLSIRIVSRVDAGNLASHSAGTSRYFATSTRSIFPSAND